MCEKANVKVNQFQVTEEELAVLARHWAEQIKVILDMWQYYGQAGDISLELYAWNRLAKIDEVLSAQKVRDILEDVNKERFVTTCVQGADLKNVAPDKETFYTADALCIIFHRSEADGRAFCLTDIGQGGWCWQTALGYKGRCPIEHFGFTTSIEALEAAQRWETEHIKKERSRIQEAMSGGEKRLGTRNSPVDCDAARALNFS
jgi:hypothetical protein